MHFDDTTVPVLAAASVWCLCVTPGEGGLNGSFGPLFAPDIGQCSHIVILQPHSEFKCWKVTSSCWGFRETMQLDMGTTNHN